jgi:hypothetical protein
MSDDSKLLNVSLLKELFYTITKSARQILNDREFIELPVEEQRKLIKTLYTMAGRRLKELQEIREKTKFPIKTFNEFAEFVNHYERAVTTMLANKGIFTSL